MISRPPCRTAVRSNAPTAGGQSTALGTNRPGQQRCSCRLTVERSTNLPIVWCCTSPLRSRERGGRTRLQNGDSQDNLPTTFLSHVHASHSRFQPITRDLGKCRAMPNFALSRRQHGFESRWGYKIKPPLTRPDTTTSQPASPRVDRQGRARDARAPAGAAFGTLQISRLRLPKHGARVPADLCCRELGPRLGPQGALAHCKPGLPDLSATTKHVRSALRTRDVDRTSRSLAASRTSHLSARTGGEK